MKFAMLLGLLLGVITEAGQAQELKCGDIIFHRSDSSQAAAIAAATNSRYTHMGIIFHDDGLPYVYEAVDPVRKTPLDDWVARGVDGHYVVKRLEQRAGFDAELLRGEVKKMVGLPYDWRFDWSDQKIYCSELVWKSYQQAFGIELCATRTLGDFDLAKPVVNDLLQKRYRGSVPIEMTVVSPADIFESELLVVVVSK